MTGLRWASATDTGLVRRNNQDFSLATGRVFAVADGMGGHVGGEVASRVAIDSLADALEGRYGTPLSADDLVAAIKQANQAVLARAEADPALRGMGTTMTVAALVVDDGEERLAIANVGDSRAYVFSEGELTQLTEDHSVPEELVRQGQLSPDEVDTHPQRHILTRALGIMAEVDADVWEVLPFTGDRVLLCSDGLVREVTDVQIASVLRRLVDPDEAARELVVRARAAGGSDNITVVIVDVVDDGGAALAASRAITGDTTGSAGPPPPEAAEENVAQSAPVMFPAVEQKRRRVTLRVALFIVILLVVVAAAGAMVVVYARGSYFVTLAPNNQIVIEQGRPGGLLWFKPTLAQRTQVTTSQVLGSRLPDLENGHAVSSVAAGRQYVANLVQEAAAAAPVNPDFTTPTTTPIAP